MNAIKVVTVVAPLQVVFMCKASLVVIIDDERFHITRRVFNQIQCDKYTGFALVLERPDKTGNILKWLAIPTMF